MKNKPTAKFPYGIIIGGIFGAALPEQAVKVKFVGDLFLMMLVVPLIFVSIVYGVTRFGDVRKMSRPVALVFRPVGNSSTFRAFQNANESQMFLIYFVQYICVLVLLAYL